MRLQSLFNVKITAEIKAAASLCLPAAWRACDAVEKLEKHLKIPPGLLVGRVQHGLVVRCWHGTLGRCLQPSWGHEWHSPCRRGRSRAILCLLESGVTDPLLPEPPCPTLCPDRLPLIPVRLRPSWSSDFAVSDPRPGSGWGSPPQAGPPPREKER